MIAAQAPGKMILIGEYAVLEGAPALVCAMDCHARASVIPNGINEFSVDATSIGVNREPFVVNSAGKVRFNPNLDDHYLKRLHLFSEIFEALWDYTTANDVRLKPCVIQLDTTAFYSAELKTKFGFGSSAALAVSLIRAILRFVELDRDLSADQLFDMAFQIHHRAQGNVGSGIDVAASTFGGVIQYVLEKKDRGLTGYVQKLSPCHDLLIAPVWSGHSTSTRQMVRGVDQLKTDHPTFYDAIMQRLKEVSEQSCQFYRDGDINSFLDTIRVYANHLSELGERSGVSIVTPSHQQIMEIAERAGAVYKPSGAGGGDIGVLFSKSPEIMQWTEELLKDTPYRLLNQKISDKGVELTSES